MTGRQLASAGQREVGEFGVIEASPQLALNDGKTYYFILQVKKITHP